MTWSMSGGIPYRAGVSSMIVVKKPGPYTQWLFVSMCAVSLAHMTVKLCAFEEIT